MSYTVLRVAMALAYVPRLNLVDRAAKILDEADTESIGQSMEYAATFYRRLAVAIVAGPTEEYQHRLTAMLDAPGARPSVRRSMLFSFSERVRKACLGPTGLRARTGLSNAVKGYFAAQFRPESAALAWGAEVFLVQPTNHALNACFSYDDTRYCPGREKLLVSEFSLLNAVVHLRSSEADLGDVWRASELAEAAVWLSRSFAEHEVEQTAVHYRTLPRVREATSLAPYRDIAKYRESLKTAAQTIGGNISGGIVALPARSPRNR